MWQKPNIVPAYFFSNISSILQLGGYGRSKIDLVEISVNIRESPQGSLIAQTSTISEGRCRTIDAAIGQASALFAAWQDKRSPASRDPSVRSDARRKAGEKFSRSKWSQELVRVSGDGYLFHKLDNGHFKCAVGLLSGHWLIAIGPQGQEFVMDQLNDTKDFFRAGDRDPHFFLEHYL